jgi:hypothetical protein
VCDKSADIACFFATIMDGLGYPQGDGAAADLRQGGLVPIRDDFWRALADNQAGIVTRRQLLELGGRPRKSDNR